MTSFERRVLGQLYTYDEIANDEGRTKTANFIARDLATAPAAVTRALNRLRHLGLTDTAPNPKDILRRFGWDWWRTAR